MTLIPNISPAAGWLKTPEAVAKLASLGLPEIAIGTFSLRRRAGNSGDTYYPDDLAPLNSMGVPSEDFDWVCDHFKEYVEAAGGSTLRFSIAPFGEGDLCHMVRRLRDLSRRYNVRIIIEVNLSCPNVWGATGQKTIISYVPSLVDKAFCEVDEGLDGSFIPVAVKFSPQFDSGLVGQLVDLCGKFGIYEIAAINTVPNATLFDLETKRTVIYARPEGGEGLIQLGGYSGPGVLPIAVGNIFMFKQAILARSRPILLKGIGGINDGSSLRQHQLAGADSFAVGFHAMKYGPKVFPEIVEDYLTKYD